MRRAVPAVLALFALAGCAGPSPAPTAPELPHRSYSAAPGAPSLTPAPAAPAPVSVEALGDRDGPFSSTTAEDVAEAAAQLGALDAGASVEPGSCSGVVGCRSSATAGDVTVIVFGTSRAAQEWVYTSAGAEVEAIGGRRYWAAVEYSALDGDARSAWRDVLREIVP